MINKSKIFDRIKTFRKERRWQSRIILTLLILTLLLVIARLLLAPTIIYGTTSWLKKQDIELTIETINIDIFDGTVSLVNAKGYSDGTPLFNVGLVDIYWRWAPLSDKTIEVTKVALDDLKVSIEKYSDEMIIGGVHIPLGANAVPEAEVPAAEADNKTKPWAAELGEVIFTDLNICYLQHNAALQQANKETLYVDYCVDLGEVSWSGTISYATDKELLKTEDIAISSSGDFKLNGLDITDNKLGRKLLTSNSNTLKNVVISGLNKLHIDELDMNELSLLQREDEKHKDSIRFHQLTIDDISLRQLNTLTINNINMEKPGVYLVKQNETDWEYQQWLPPADDGSQPDETKDSKQASTSQSSFKVSLKNIDISESDLCYLDNSTSIYYCLTFSDFAWNGSIDYDTRTADSDDINLAAKGDLDLLRPNVHNHSIERNLIALSSLSLDGLDITGINKVALKNFSVEKLSALQRSNNNDDYTAAFDELSIDDILYTTNKVAVKSILLSGLTNTVSINKDGSWEHDKWLQNSKKEKETGDPQTVQQAADGEPFIIALQKLKVTSDKKTTFTDNSTQPATNVGLQNLNFDISDIYSEKPDSESPFKLNAKTLLHSTIDIEGKVKPFAEKISFDADGKLKGFDLRVASPATKKAIGHIIKSGQLDADLKLLAVDGVLDSNIGLSLYHFNIKATSKEDADKLDEKFGMPLNQTLVLLRDKDDSIHLDIPITGDVNNPDFNPMDAIVKATSKAATVTLITFYTPYGLIYAGGNMAFNLATALNFDPLNFTPGSSEITADNKEQLGNLSKLLTEKPQVRLTLCGVTNQQDALALFPELKEQLEKSNKEGKKSGVDIKLTTEQSSKLDQLARDRQDNSKNYLIDSHGIAHDRLVVCEPEYRKEADAIAGVEINI
ncbi:MAG: DUF748 domain-containing protein [Gammaproteobacteria bacterium]|nr:DUF748 domain-containing protein [Gammaproteobacteria bacterium]